MVSLLTGARTEELRWTPPRPVNVYVIEHANALVLFDTGQDRASVTDDAYFPGGFTGLIYDRLARFDIGEQDTLTAQLALLGYAPADVDTAILSHLHEDHIGGIAELKDADLLVSAAECAELSEPAPEPPTSCATTSTVFEPARRLAIDGQIGPFQATISYELTTWCAIGDLGCSG